MFFSIMAWSVMIFKAIQMRRAKKLNLFFTSEFKTQKTVLDMFDRRIQAEGCPLFAVYQAGSIELDARLKTPESGRKKFVSIKSIEHVKRLMENTVAQESLKLESGLILLAIAVSGGPFLGLLGTVWGVMSTFSGVAQAGQRYPAAMAPGVAAALITTVAGLLVAIPSMFGYNWLVHNLRVLTVELDNFAQEIDLQDGDGVSGRKMRRFSQRSHLVTLSEINITPLLDLAFVLLIIFIITTPLMENGMELKLPAGRRPGRPATRTRTTSRPWRLARSGSYAWTNSGSSLDALEAALVQANKANPNTVVYIRADENGLDKDLWRD